MTGIRLLAVHNLAYLERLVRGAREAIRTGAFAGYRKRILGGVAPWGALKSGSR
jgi:queuine/archaeosine tRNA-ribosyltransferase